MTDDILNLSGMQLDALREIGNVGAGNSATALSQIIQRKIDMSVPQVSILPLADVPDVVGGRGLPSRFWSGAREYSVFIAKGERLCLGRHANGPGIWTYGNLVGDG